MQYSTDDCVAIITRECARCSLTEAETIEIVDMVLNKLSKKTNEITEAYVKKVTLNTIRSHKRKKHRVQYCDLTMYEDVAVVGEEGQTLSDVLTLVLEELYALLTPRQRQIFELSARNYTVAAIAKLLGVSTRLVVKERQHILRTIRTLFAKYHIQVKRQRFRARKNA